MWPNTQILVQDVLVLVTFLESIHQYILVAPQLIVQRSIRYSLFIHGTMEHVIKRQNASSCAPSSAANNGKEVVVVNEEHKSVIERLSEVATTEYPFQPIPKPVKLPQHERLNIKSSNHMNPVLWSLFYCLVNFLSLPLFVLCTVVLVLPTTTSSVVVRNICGTFACACAWNLATDPFFVHRLTGGRFGLHHRSGGRDVIYRKNNPQNERLANQLSKFLPYRPTPYLWSGDLLTLLPFVQFKGSKGKRVHYQRWWLRVPSAPAPDGCDGPFQRPGQTDDEAVALDISFPDAGHDPSKTTLLILHGLNGGSTEPYVLDLVRRANFDGSTAVVMINRGLMKTPMKGEESFTGARTSDVGCTVDALLHALGGDPERSSGKLPQTAKILLVGFSMGGIIAANYVSKSKDRSGLIGCISFSGTLCSENMIASPTLSSLATNRAARHSLKMWQPALAWGLKGTICKQQLPNLIKRNITSKDLESIATVLDLDDKVVCKYHKYETVRHYYEDMSAAGRGDAEGIERLKRVAVPTLILHAQDDPIAIFEVAVPDIVCTTDNVMLLATRHGGHIGWPLGWRPSLNGWRPSLNRWSFMVDIAMEFASALDDKSEH